MNFGNAWRRMSPMQKQDFMATVVRALYEKSILNEREVAEANKYFTLGYHDTMTKGASIVFDAIHRGLIRFESRGNAIAVYFPNNVDRLIEAIAYLPPMEQFDKMNEVVQDLRNEGHITSEEADEAFSDIMKVFIFKRYNHHSRGTTKVMASLHKVLDSDDDDYEDDD